MLPIVGMWNKIDYSIDIKEIPKGFDVSVTESGAQCSFTIEEGKMVRFSLLQEVPSYYLLASLIGNAVHQCGYEKLKVPKELVTVVYEKKVVDDKEEVEKKETREIINVIRVDETNIEKRKLMEAINETGIGILKAYTHPYAYSVGSKDHKYAEGVIRAISELPEHNKKMKEFMMKDSIKQLKNRGHDVISGTFDNHTYQLEKYQKKDTKNHFVRIKLDGELVCKYLCNKEGFLFPSDFNTNTRNSLVVSYLLHYSLSFLGLKKLKVPSELGYFYDSLKIEWNDKTREIYKAIGIKKDKKKSGWGYMRRITAVQFHQLSKQMKETEPLGKEPAVEKIEAVVDF